MTDSALVRIGLTGGIASGKSTVAAMMAAAGCWVTDADRLVAELYRPDAAGAAAVASLFGRDYLTADGSVDTEKVAQLVFADEEARRRLEHEIHPLVGREFARRAVEHGGIAVFEATLLVDTGGYRGFDALVTVEADEERRIQRAVERGLDETDARARLAAQATSEKRTAVADFVIWNDGTLDDLQQQVDEVLAALRQRLGATNQAES